MTTTHSRFMNLIARGLRVRCSRMGTYFDFIDTNPDGKGGRIAKKFDTLIEDASVEQSKHKEGPGWVRGLNR